MKKLIPLAALAVSLSACGMMDGMMTQPTTQTHWSCLQAKPTQHKDQKPESDCGICPGGYSNYQCIPAEKVQGVNHNHRY